MSCMNILILNWRDIRNPNSGGAEILTQEMAKRWVLWGHEVTQFSSYFEGAKPEEIIDGVKFIRKGNPDARSLLNSVHFLAFLFFLKHKSSFDVVMDEIHGIPFFTPLYVVNKKVALICEVAGKIWDANFSFPFNILGKVVESNYFRFYKNIPFLTISPSTEKDLIRLGVCKENITVLPMGISIPGKLPSLAKEKCPTIIFVGRLIKAKGVEDAIEVCRILKEDFPNIKLWIIGRGEILYENELKEKIKLLGLSRHVDFFGFVSQEEKFEALQKAHMLLAPSIKEGFGLTVPEAGLVGTPTIAYNVEGLNDIIINMENGILVDSSPDSMATQIKKMFNEKRLYKRLQDGAYKYAKSLSWDETAKKALALFEKS